MPSQSRNTASFTLTVDQICHAFVGLGNVFETQCEDWAFFWHHICKLKFHRQWQCFLKVFISICTVDKLFTDIKAIGFMIFVQQAQQKFGCTTMHPQIFSENHITHGFWNSNFICYFTSGQTTIWVNHFPNFFFIFSSFFGVEGCPEHSLYTTEVWPSLKSLYHLWVCVLLMTLSPNASFNISNVSESICPNLEQNFTKTRCSIKSHILNCRKMCRASKICIHSNTHSTMIKQTRMIWCVAFTKGNQLLCSTTSGTSLHLHFGMLIQKFRNFTDCLHTHSTHSAFHILTTGISSG